MGAHWANKMFHCPLRSWVLSLWNLPLQDIAFHSSHIPDCNSRKDVRRGHRRHASYPAQQAPGVAIISCAHMSLTRIKSLASSGYKQGWKVQSLPQTAVSLKAGPSHREEDGG